MPCQRAMTGLAPYTGMFAFALLAGDVTMTGLAGFVSGELDWPGADVV